MSALGRAQALTPERDQRAGPVLPLAVHIGFSGPRRLPVAEDRQAEAEATLRESLRTALAGLPAALGLGAQHFYTGVSQMAAGADTLFAEVAAELGWLHRVLLPQPTGEFLSAVGSQGPDFTDAQRARAEGLLRGPQVADVAVASTAETRAERFTETNLRILGLSDVLVVVVVDGAVAKPGGAGALLDRARARGMHRLVLTLRTDAQGGLQVRSDWESPPGRAYVPPRLPATLQAHASPLAWAGPSAGMAEAYARIVKDAGSLAAKRRQRFFRYAAGVVVLTHVLATTAALIAMKLPAAGYTVLGVLAVELVLLLWGLLTHRSLHHRKSTRDWAMSRLCAEIARSALALRGIRVPLVPQQDHAVPTELDALLRTMNVLHLHAGRVQPARWPEVRERYLQERLLSAPHGQLGYFEREAGRSGRWAAAAGTLFTVLSSGAVVFTTFKFGQIAAGAGASSTVGVLAVLLPVAAVAIMSLSAAFDLEAREHTFGDMLGFAQHRVAELQAASSLGEFAELAARTEAGLMAETIGWVGRRSYLGIS